MGDHLWPVCVYIIEIDARLLNPDISRVGCAHMQGIRAEDVVVYLKALITWRMSAPGSPEG